VSVEQHVRDPETWVFEKVEVYGIFEGSKELNTSL